MFSYLQEMKHDIYEHTKYRCVCNVHIRVIEIIREDCSHALKVAPNLQANTLAEFGRINGREMVCASAVQAALECSSSLIIVRHLAHHPRSSSSQ